MNEFEVPDWFPRRRDRLRQGATNALAKVLFERLPLAIQKVPRFTPARAGVDVIKNIPYLPTGESAHTLDVYFPLERTRPLPVVMYIHVGGFRLCPKDTHAAFATEFARQGYTVFNINYRLAPKYPFPHGLSDAANAYRWIVENAHHYHGDISSFAVAGESAGGNFTVALTMGFVFGRNDAVLDPALSTKHMPDVILPACAYLDLENDHFHSNQGKPQVVLDRIRTIVEGYMGDLPRHAQERELISPLRFFEHLVESRTKNPVSDKWPPTLIPCGGGDVVLSHSTRFYDALKELGAPCELKTYGNEPHAFHGITFRKEAKACWRDMHEFLRTHMPQPT